MMQINELSKANAEAVLQQCIVPAFDGAAVCNGGDDERAVVGFVAEVPLGGAAAGCRAAAQQKHQEALAMFRGLASAPGASPLVVNRFHDGYVDEEVHDMEAEAVSTGVCGVRQLRKCRAATIKEGWNTVEERDACVDVRIREGSVRDYGKRLSLHKRKGSLHRLSGRSDSFVSVCSTLSDLTSASVSTSASEHAKHDNCDDGDLEEGAAARAVVVQVRSEKEKVTRVSKCLGAKVNVTGGFDVVRGFAAVPGFREGVPILRVYCVVALSEVEPMGALGICVSAEKVRERGYVSNRAAIPKLLGAIAQRFESAKQL